MLQHVLCVLVGKGQEPGADKGADGKDDGIGGDVDGVDTPVEPHWDGRDYECVAIEQGTGLGGDVLVEAFQQQLLFSGNLCLFLWRHCQLSSLLMSERASCY